HQVPELCLDGRRDLERRHVQVRRDPVDVGVPSVPLDQRGRVERDRPAREERDLRAGRGHEAASAGAAASASGGKARLRTNRSLKSAAPESSTYSTKDGSSNATSRSRNDIRAIFAPSPAVLPTALIRSTGTGGTRPTTRADRGLM